MEPEDILTQVLDRLPQSTVGWLLLVAVAGIMALGAVIEAPIRDLWQWIIGSLKARLARTQGEAAVLKKLLSEGDYDKSDNPVSDRDDIAK